jgi:hypothetical protein
MNQSPLHQVKASIFTPKGVLATDNFPYDEATYGAVGTDSAELIQLFHAPAANPMRQYLHVAVLDGATKEILSEIGELPAVKRDRAGNIKPGYGRISPHLVGMTDTPGFKRNLSAEVRRHTRDLTGKELKYFLQGVLIKGTFDRDLMQQVIVDAILYYAQPGKEVLAIEEGGKQMSYYLGIKANNIYVDYKRHQNAYKRGSGNVVSIDALAERVEGATDVLGFLAGSDSADMLDLDAQVLRQAIFGVLADKPDKLRLFELHLEGLSPAQITVALGWGEADENGKVDSGRARKSLLDTLTLLKKRLPALAGQRPRASAQWGEGSGESRATRHLSSADCEMAALALEGPVSFRERKRLKVGAAV